MQFFINMNFFTALSNIYNHSITLSLCILSIIWLYGLGLNFANFFNIFKQENFLNLITRLFLGLLLFPVIIQLLSYFFPINLILIYILIILNFIYTFITTKTYEFLNGIKLIFIEVKNNKFLYFVNFIFLLFLYSNINFDHDSLWYHFTIPRMFLYNESINFLGDNTRYSVHMYINFHWNLLAFIQPLKVIYQLLFINYFQMLLVYITLIFSTKYLTSNNKISNKFLNDISFAFPILIFSAIELVNWSYRGYNDIYGYIIGLIIGIIILEINKSKNYNLYFPNLVIFLILAGMVKIHFLIFIICFLSMMVLLCLITKKINIHFINFNKHLKIFLIASLIYLLWFIRGYVQTGYPLYPAGAPSLLQDVFEFIKMNPSDYYKYGFFKRWFNILFTQLPSVFGMLYIIAIARLFVNWKKISFEKIIILSSVFGMTMVNLITVSGDYRYLFMGLGVISIIGISNIQQLIENYNQIQIVYRRILLLSILILFGFNFSQIINIKHWENSTFFVRNAEALALKTTPSHPLWYYPSVVPNNMKDNDTVFVAGFHKLGYFPNKFYSFESIPGVKEIINSQNQLNTYLENKKIKYLAIQNLNENSEIGKLIFGNNKIKKLLFDERGYVTWFSFGSN